MKQQILFVDDERNILEGYQRMFRPLRDEWDTHYAVSGSEALEIMNATPIDLIITDMRMPKMNGAELLHIVTKRHPSVIRIVLSGNADSAAMMELVGVAHQFISKPCNPEIFESIIRNVLSFRSFLADDNLKKTLSQMDAVPCLPALYIEMTEELQSPEPSLQKVGQIIARDCSMTARILQLANSPFWGLRRTISSAAEAVSYLGLEPVQLLFLSIRPFSQSSLPKTSSCSIELLWEHGLSTATLAKTIACEEEASDMIAEEAFTAGILHDMGKVVLACTFPERYAEAVNLAQKSAIPLWLAEQQILSVTHAEVGAYLLGIWGLPDSIVEAVAYHHRPMECTNNIFCALTALHAADSQNTILSHTGIPRPQADLEYLSRLLRRTQITAVNMPSEKANQVQQQVYRH
jgi:HD-like signal output (HDOD) protein